MARRADPSRPATRWFDAWRGVLYANAKVLRLADADLVARFGFPLSWLDVLAQLHDAPANSLRIQELQAGSVFNPAASRGSWTASRRRGSCGASGWWAIVAACWSP